MSLLSNILGYAITIVGFLWQGIAALRESKIEFTHGGNKIKRRIWELVGTEKQHARKALEEYYKKVKVRTVSLGIIFIVGIILCYIGSLLK